MEMSDVIFNLAGLSEDQETLWLVWQRELFLWEMVPTFR